MLRQKPVDLVCHDRAAKVARRADPDQTRQGLRTLPYAGLKVLDLA